MSFEQKKSIEFNSDWVQFGTNSGSFVRRESCQTTSVIRSDSPPELYEH